MYDTAKNMGFAGLRACMEANCHVNEEPYEVCLDNHGCCDGAKAGRLRASDNVGSSSTAKNFNMTWSWCHILKL